jgi:restriction endonuclease S subunit
MIVQIRDICSAVYSGGTPNRKHLEYYEGGDIPWLNTSEVVFNRIYKTEKHITQSGLKNSSAKWIPENSVIVAMYGATAGRTAIAKKPLTTNQACCNLIIDPEKADYRYVYYYLYSKYQHLLSMANGGAQQNLNAGQIKEYMINLPDLQTQKKIADILDLLDSKIELNNTINNNLEQQAQALFKKWFIDNPENVDWSAGTFRELIQSTLNGDWGKEAPTGNNTEKVYCIRGADIPEVKAGNKGKMPTRYILPKNLANKKLEAGDIVVEISGGSPTQSTGRCTAITQSLLDRYDSSMVCTNFCKAIKPKNGYSLFVYYYWQYLYEKGVFFSYENGTTGIKNLDFTGFIETEPIIIPPFDKVQEFDDYCNSIFSQVFANGKQSEQLASLRDTLLPKLMSGELDVSDIEL